MSFIFLVIPYLLLISSSNTGRRRYLMVLQFDTVTFCPAACVSLTVNSFWQECVQTSLLFCSQQPSQIMHITSPSCFGVRCSASYSESETGDFVNFDKCEYKYRTLVIVYAFVSVAVHNNGFLGSARACCLECNRFSKLEYQSLFLVLRF